MHLLTFSEIKMIINDQFDRPCPAGYKLAGFHRAPGQSGTSRSVIYTNGGNSEMETCGEIMRKLFKPERRQIIHPEQQQTVCNQPVLWSTLTMILSNWK